ncbi:mannose/fructose/sorbose PTS transporter subunit IIB [Liquorilactobacillus vini]|uniref:Pts system mannose-specific iib component n=1 Tax=Liquorilactobacillus vini DSM 20605 TaxID=1133569 RepID=A0A0R2CM75_9LACO|nr:mannose/fructose/sorbose PTS transporter subunit IIB [Liquorilactobacillus vini]KRM88915.1 pts system mannose-specific iib component [Liquorilactobacillus vini DSM 20605]
MIIKLVRIDDRFIHGQILTKWIKSYPVERIIIVSQEIANDPMRKILTLSVAPANIKASVVSPSKMVKVFNNPKYQSTSAMLLFGNPSEVVEIVENQLSIKSVNVGGMRFDQGKLHLTESVSVTAKDIKAFMKLNELGVKLELRQLPSDSKRDFLRILQNHHK